ncbi:hypothetical protein AVEN_173078-1 [Araneus ventricosus]|uniref:Uncharacterized protein n=1 Tax=Araneus ventricosus TaxID=182803 RepID=A0A4Y2HE71_ARAVE|nr:hypothetical protein AVEN_173078-1 [Araneus ventricosus]
MYHTKIFTATLFLQVFLQEISRLLQTIEEISASPNHREDLGFSKPSRRSRHLQTVEEISSFPNHRGDLGFSKPSRRSQLLKTIKDPSSIVDRYSLILLQSKIFSTCCEKLKRQAEKVPAQVQSSSVD